MSAAEDTQIHIDQSPNFRVPDLSVLVIEAVVLLVTRSVDCPLIVYVKEIHSSYKPPWAHSDLCTLQLSPLYHRDEGIEEGSRNKYLCMV